MHVKKIAESTLCQVGEARALFLGGKHLHSAGLRQTEKADSPELLSSYRTGNIQGLERSSALVCHLGKGCLTLLWSHDAQTVSSVWIYYGHCPRITRFPSDEWM